MEKDAFMQQVSNLRQKGTSIRGIASNLGVSPGRVQKAVVKLVSPQARTSGSKLFRDNQESVFVGREVELALLRKTLDETAAGRGHIVLLSGEPGIGKTRLAEELCSYASSRKVASYWGRCHEETQVPPFWPWVQIFRKYIQRHRASRIRTEMGMAAADIAGIVPKLLQSPQLLQKLPELEPEPPLNDPSEDRFRLFDSISGFFKRSSKRQPILLVLDNLQWCDEPSLLLLRFISQELAENRVIILASYRNMGLEHNHPLTTSLGELLCRPSCQHIDLPGLTRSETDQMVRAQGPPDSSQRLMETLYNHTEGNPLFIIHLYRSLKKGGIFTGNEKELDLSGLNGVPDSLNMAISRNLACLSSPCRELLLSASVIGLQFNLAILQRTIKHLTTHELYDLLDEAAGGGIIRQSNSRSGWYQFTHVLIQETLLKGIRAQQRTDLHARIGHALEEIYENDIAFVSAQLAYHFNRSVDLTGPDKAIHYSRLVAEQALAMFAYEEAVLHFQRALGAKQQKTPAAVDGIPDDETAEILMGLVKSQAAISVVIMQEPFKIMSKLLDYYMDKKDITSIIELAKIPMVMLNRISISEPKRRLEQVLNMVNADSSEFGWLQCIYGYYIGAYGGEYKAAQDAFDHALVIARQQGDQSMEMRALVNTVVVKAIYWEVDWGVLLRVIDIAQRLEDRQVEAIGRFYHAAFSTNTRQRVEAEKLWEQAMSIAGQLRHSMLLNALTSTGQLLAQYYGDFRTSRLRSEQVVGGHGRNLLSPIIRAITEYELGELEEGDRSVRQVVEELDQNPAGLSAEYSYIVSQLPFVSYLTGKEEWYEVEDRVIDMGLNVFPRGDFFSLMLQVGLGLRAINRGDITMVRKSYNLLNGPLKSDPVRSMISPIAMSSDRLLGLLCLASQDYDRAIEHFQDAIEYCREWGFSPQLAWSCYDCSRVMLRRNKPGDLAKANTLAAQALSVADELGMKLLSGKVNSMAEIKESKPVSIPDGNNFTSREIEVLKLLAKGKTNREIALDLFISIHTAATHVRNILNKGNMANRVEAAAFAERHYSPAK